MASVDPGTEVAQTVERAGAGLAVGPDDAEAFTKAVLRLLDHPDEAAEMGAAGRRFVESWASPRMVATAYEALFEELRSGRPCASRVDFRLHGQGIAGQEGGARRARG